MAAPRFSIVIPARFASSRYPGKPLVPLTGATGVAKPLIRRSHEAAAAVPGCAAVVVATDDDRIAEVARGFGAAVAMTPSSCANGTERCAAAVAAITADIDIVVNLQGDAPLTPPWFIEAIVAGLAADARASMATPAVHAAPAIHRRLLDDQRAGRVGGTCVVTAADGHALYFSKAVIPHVPAARLGDPALPVFLHVGAYAYRRAALVAYAAHPECALERLEGLEQLRFLDMGAAVAVVPVDARGRDVWELNNPEDVAPIEAALKILGIV